MSARADLAGGQAKLTATLPLTTAGQLAIAGTIGLAAPYPSALGIALDGVTLRDPDLYEAQAQGALKLTGPLAGQPLLSGQINLIKTELRVPSTGFGGAAGLPDPPQISMDEAQLVLSPSRLSFLNESRQVSNRRMLHDLKVQLRYADVDADGYGDTADAMASCSEPAGYTALGSDCDDGDAAYNPGAAEACDDPNDYNCDGSVAYEDADGDGFAACSECFDERQNSCETSRKRLLLGACRMGGTPCEIGLAYCTPRRPFVCRKPRAFNVGERRCDVAFKRQTPGHRHREPNASKDFPALARTFEKFGKIESDGGVVPQTCVVGARANNARVPTCESQVGIEEERKFFGGRDAQGRAVLGHEMFDRCIRKRRTRQKCITMRREIDRSAFIRAAAREHSERCEWE